MPDRTVRSHQSGIARSTWLRWGGGIAAIVLALLFALTFGPHLFRDRIAARVAESIGRSVSVEAVETSPLRGGLTLRNVTVGGREGEQALLEVPEAALQLSVPKLLRGDLQFDAVTLQSPTLRIARVDPKRFDFYDIVERLGEGRDGDTADPTLVTIEQLQINDGTIVFEDRVLERTIEITQIEGRLPWFSTRPDDRDRPIQGDVRFTIDGRPARIQVSGVPFADQVELDVAAAVDTLPLALIAPYAPLPEDVRIADGTVSADLRLAYRPAAPTQEQAFTLRGSVVVEQLSVADAQGRERVAIARIDAALEPSLPLANRMHFENVALQSPRATVGRDSQGRLAWPRLPQRADDGTGTELALRIDRFAIADAALAYSDEALSPPLALRAAPLQMSAQQFELAVSHTDGTRLGGRIELSAVVDEQARVGASAVLEGTRGSAQIKAEQVPLARYGPHLPYITPKIQAGMLALSTGVDWDLDTGGWRVVGADADLAGLHFVDAQQHGTAIEQLQVRGVSVDLGVPSASAAQVRLNGAILPIVRRADGSLNLLQWIDLPEPEVERRWRYRVNQVELSALQVDFADFTIARDRLLPRTRIDLRATNLSSDLAQTASLDLSAQVADGSRAAVKGQVRPRPLDIDARIDVRQFGFMHLEPYVRQFLNLALQSGEVWSSGRTRVTADDSGNLSRIAFNGELSLNNVRALDRVNRTDFLRWNALVAPTISVDWRPGAPERSMIEVGDMAFVDFFGRVILDSEGNLNLRYILADLRDGNDDGGRPRSLTEPREKPQSPNARERDARDAPAAFPFDEVAPAASPRAPQRNSPPQSRERAQPQPQPPAKPQPQPQANPQQAAGQREGREQAANDAALPTIRIGTLRVASGNVNFTDNFVQPNYTVNLTRLTGEIHSLTTDSPEPAKVTITGNIDDEAPVEIVGAINPLPPQRFLDLSAAARGIDLRQLTPYAMRWAGYTVQQGTLSANVRYRIEGSQLRGENRFVLNQFRLGEQVDPDATGLPIRLAVSLLRDRHGNIDIEVPISGSLDDPDFNIWPLIGQAIGNVIERIVTAPFRALARVAGLGDDNGDLSFITFAPGTSQLTPQTTRQLEALARALRERPGLTLRVEGFADVVVDRQALQRQALELELLRARQAQLQAQGVKPPPLEQIELTAEERAALVAQLYNQLMTDTPKPPGPAAATIGVEQMETLLAQGMPVTIQDLRTLALHRAAVTRNFLIERGGIAANRLPLGPARVEEPGDKKPPGQTYFTIEAEARAR